MLIDMNSACKMLESIKSSDAVILIHQSPDGDCIGAGYALRELLAQLGIRSRVECSDIIPKRYDFITKGSSLPEYEDLKPQYVISVDVADPQLLGNAVREKYGDSVMLCIDHHVSNVGYAENTLLFPKASATCEIIYNLAASLGLSISDYTAACIYTGIATDTGCFKYGNTSPECHEIAASLMRQHSSIKYESINREMFDVKSVGRIKMESSVIELMEFYYDSRLTMICITADIMQKMGVDSNDLEGCASLPLQVEGVEVGILLKEREENVYKVSMRSANDVNVSEICITLGGGGHAKAAGCLLRGSIEDVKKQLIEAVGKALDV